MEDSYELERSELRERFPDCKVLFEFIVLWEGWEMDNTAWVVEDATGERFIINTSHGGAYRAEPNFIGEKIELYEKVLSDTKKAIEMLKS